MIKYIAILLCLVLTCSVASATCTVYTCTKDHYCPGASQRLTLGNATIDYTVIQVGNNSTKVQFKDLSKGKETYIRWDFGDGTHLESTKITDAIKNPIHVFPKKGRYIGGLTISCTTKKGNLLWVHKDVVLK